LSRFYLYSGYNGNASNPLAVIVKAVGRVGDILALLLAEVPVMA
jgi:hypothetical protein